jgi:hypothetical protein
MMDTNRAPSALRLDMAFSSVAHKTNVSDQRKQTQQPAPPAHLPEWQIQNLTAGAVREASLAWK